MIYEGQRSAVRHGGGKADDRPDVAGVLHTIECDDDRGLPREEVRQRCDGTLEKADHILRRLRLCQSIENLGCEIDVARDDLDRLPPGSDRVGDRLRSFDHDLRAMFADGFADAFEPGVLLAADLDQLECALLAGR